MTTTSSLTARSWTTSRLTTSPGFEVSEEITCASRTPIRVPSTSRTLLELCARAGAATTSAAAAARANREIMGHLHDMIKRDSIHLA